MADVKPELRYTISVNAAEFKLINRALAMMINADSKEARDALELNGTLLNSRAGYLADLSRVATGALRKAEAALRPTSTPNDPLPAPTQTDDNATISEHN